ncbi:MAG TPA: hypothetical protein VFL64_22475, partial [Rhizobacter sp.]|nr:hypothetical protein [Rhizobacter sp.]
GLAPNSLRGLWPLRSDRRREVRGRSVLAHAAPKPCAARRLTKGPKRRLAFGFVSRLASLCRDPAEAKRGEAMSSAVAADVRPILWHGEDRPRRLEATQFGHVKSAFALVTFIWRDK